MSTRCAKVLTGGDPRRRFAYFAAVGKVGRPSGRNVLNKKVGATCFVTPTREIFRKDQEALELLPELPLELLLESPELSSCAAVTSACTAVRRAVSWV